MSCNCNCDSTPITIPTGAAGAPGAAGTNGTNGTNGSNGVFGGNSAMWKFSTSAGTGPNATELRFNNVNPALATKVYINDVDANSINLNAFMQTIIGFPNDSGVYSSYIRVFKEFDSNVFFTAKIIGITDNGTDVEFTLDAATRVTNGTFALNNNVVATFTQSGATGAPGVGTNGVTVLRNTLSKPSSTAAVAAPLDTYSMPANTLAANGDRLHVKFIVGGNLNKLGGNLQILVNGLFYTTAFPNYFYAGGNADSGQFQGIVDMWIERISNTSLAISSEYISVQVRGQAKFSQAWSENAASVGVIDCTNNVIPIRFTVTSDGANALTALQTLVELHKT
jgi:hypothetical protein